MKSMNKKPTSVYLYLGRHDKAGVRIVAVFTGQKQAPVRVSDLQVLQLPASLHGQVSQIIHNDRMMWEPWIESAETYDELKTSLRRRGYTGIPTSGHSELMSGFISTPTPVAQRNLPKVKTMVRKKA